MTAECRRSILVFDMSRDHSEQYVAVSTEPTLQQTTMIRKTNILKTNGIRLYGLIGIILIIGCILAIVLHHVNSSSTYTSASLKFVFMVTRHGARAPLRMYSNDPYKNITKYWPEGMGGLTNLGKQQMYKLGQTFRNMYNGFLNEHYISKEFKAQSTMSERTLMSAATLLAGLYPPKTYQIWSSTINWQPIPVYSTDIDKYYIPTKPYLCPAFWKEQNNSIGKFSIKNSTQQELYDILTKYTGEIVNSIVQVGYIWDALTSEFWNDKKLPDWAQEIFPDKMIHTVIEGFDTFSVKTQTMVQLLVGPLLNLLVSYMSDKINHKLQPDMKMFYHSGHDLTLLGLKKALGINNIGIVNPASSLILELHHSKENNYYVKMLLIEGTKATPEVVETEIPNCVTPCYFDSFVITLSKYLVTDWNKECNLTN